MLWRVAVWFNWQRPHSLVREKNGAWRTHGPRGRKRLSWKLTMTSSWALAAVWPWTGPGRWGHACRRNALIGWWDRVFDGLRTALLGTLAALWPANRRVRSGGIVALMMAVAAVAAPNPVQSGEGELNGNRLNQLDLASSDGPAGGGAGNGPAGAGAGGAPSDGSGAGPGMTIVAVPEPESLESPLTGDPTGSGGPESGGDEPITPPPELAGDPPIVFDQGISPGLPSVPGPFGNGGGSGGGGGGSGGGGSGGGGGGAGGGPTSQPGQGPSTPPSDPGQGPILIDTPDPNGPGVPPTSDDPLTPGNPLAPNPPGGPNGDPKNPAVDLPPIEQPGAGDPRDPPVTPGGIPEPATWLSMILGLGGIGVMLRRRRGVAADRALQG